MKLNKPLRLMISDLTELNKGISRVKVQKPHIDGTFILTPQVNRDPRGSFLELIRSSTAAKLIAPEARLMQWNIAQNGPNVGRGFHAEDEDKFIACLDGRIYDVCVDVRPNSKTFKKVFATVLDAKTPQVLAISRGIAHGYFVIDTPSQVSYLVTEEYPNLDPAKGRTIRLDDPDIRAQLYDLPLTGELVASSKDLGQGDGANVGKFLKDI